MRDHYDWELACPVCGTKGNARVSEDAFPEIGNLNFTIDELSEGFRIRTPGGNASTAAIVCVTCDVIV